MAVLGFRRFLVDGRGRLLSLSDPNYLNWQPNKDAVARCARGRITVLVPGVGDVPTTIHGPVSPDTDCSCGLYAYASPIKKCACGHPSATTHGAVGVVRMWGRVVHCRYEDGPVGGYRAQFARVVAIRDYTGRLHPDYKAPRYPSLQAMYSEWRIDTPQKHTPGEYADAWCRDFGPSQAGHNGEAMARKSVRRWGGQPQGLMQPMPASFPSFNMPSNVYSTAIQNIIRRYQVPRGGGWNPPTDDKPAD